MITSNNLNKNHFFTSLNDAYGSKRNFERELIHKAYKVGNKGKLYFTMNRYLNFYVSNIITNQEYILLTCNLDSCDIYNFIEDIDYTKLSNAYLEIKRLIESK